MQRWLAVGMFALAALRPLAADTAAVLPFLNKTPNATNLNWIGESVAETVREAFGITGVMTLDRNEVLEAYRRLSLRQELALTEASIMKIGETLDAEQVVYGSFQFTPPTSGPITTGSLRVTARVLDRRHMRAGPEFTETGALEDLPTIEAHLAWRALTQIAPTMAPAEAEFRSLRPPIRLDAEENYIRGLLANSSEQKEKYFSQAAHLDPHFAHAYYQLGQIHYQRKEYKLAVAALEKVGLADIHAHEASFLLGLARFHTGDYKGSQQTFQMIAAAVPLGEVFNNLGAAESRANLPQASVDDFRRALEGDANDPSYRFNLGYALWKKGDFSAAAESFRTLLNLDPNDPSAALLLARCLKKQGPRANPDPRLDNLERLKTNFEERAYMQLKSLLAPSTPKADRP
ncbi:MAG TPA: tetratricopeptide repeat protein [Bryobacteraceae bacterium]|jgi:tetratricopeptide (TPR) repeat protein|nr:tetratricopeptide repeat protein [Bryobacteraceae bacterium]